MPYLIGTDEAGYGPNLGPLVISASVWEAPDGVGGEDLYERLDGVIASRAGILPAQKHRQDACGTVAMADSKALYQSGKGLRLLERGLWAAFALLDKRPCTCRDVWALLAPDCEAQRQAGLCDGEGHPAPLDAAPAELIELGTRVREGTAAAGVRLVSLQSRVVFPAEFNDTVEQCGSKGLALSRWTLELAARAMAPLSDGRISILCDKHGGRDRYLPLLMEHFPEAFIEIHAEGRQRSVYGFGPAERRVEFCFQAKGEAHLPTALASMASKYLRELAMKAWNSFWCSRVPGLAPTAGYPSDAVRFKADIAAAQKELGIEDRLIWRNK